MIGMKVIFDPRCDRYLLEGTGVKFNKNDIIEEWIDTYYVFVKGDFLKVTGRFFRLKSGDIVVTNV